MHFEQVFKLGMFPKQSSLTLSTRKLIACPLLKKKKRKSGSFKTLSPGARIWTFHYLILEFPVYPSCEVQRKMLIKSKKCNERIMPK